MNKLKLNYCLDDLKYHIFGLFPYFAKDDNGNMALYKGNTTPDGCYGQIACGIKLPCDFIVDNVKILESGKSYQFNTLYKCYKKYKKLINNDFIKFMNIGIGRIKVNANIDWNICDLVPETINRAECGDLFNTMTKMKIVCDRYINRKAQDGVINCDMECMVDKYNRMGGDVMIAYYKAQSLQTDTIATKYMNYADTTASFFTMHICLNTSVHDIGAGDCYTDIWSPYERYYKGDIIVYEDYSYVCKGKFDEYGTDIGVIAEYDDVECKYIFDTNYYDKMVETLTDNDVYLSGESNSKLREFRKYTNYISTLGEVEIPRTGEDWLYYYKVNATSGCTTIKDNIGNIDIIDGTSRITTIGQYDTNLLAYGDILTKIEVEPSDYEIKFTYVIGAHLKAKLIGLSNNEFNEAIFKYDDFEYDDSDIYHGVTYSESYYYEPSGEIDTMVSNGTFDSFISSDSVPGMEFVKGSFITFANLGSTSYELNGTSLDFSFISSNFNSVVNKDREGSVYPMVKADYYDSVGYSPKITNNIRFSRGNAAAFERHIKLGEVKSFDDLSNYQNGGFFNIVK